MPISCGRSSERVGFYYYLLFLLVTYDWLTIDVADERKLQEGAGKK